MDISKYKDDIKTDLSDNHRIAHSYRSSKYRNEPRIDLDQIEFNTVDQPYTHNCKNLNIHNFSSQKGNTITKHQLPKHKKKFIEKHFRLNRYILVGFGMIILLLSTICIDFALKILSKTSTDQSSSFMNSIFSSFEKEKIQKSIVQNTRNNDLDKKNVRINPQERNFSSEISIAKKQKRNFSILEVQDSPGIKVNSDDTLVQLKDESKMNRLKLHYKSVIPKQGIKQELAMKKKDRCPSEDTTKLKYIESKTDKVIKPSYSIGYGDEKNPMYKSTDIVNSFKSALPDSYTLQLSSSSNYKNLNTWASKSSLKNYFIYKTTRYGKPWFTLVSGIYSSKHEAKNAISDLPVDIQTNEPWIKPIIQVQKDLR